MIAYNRHGVMIEAPFDAPCRQGPMTTAANRVYDAIRRAILAGQFPTGHHLTEAALAAWLGVSRTPIREVLRRLHAEGLVDFVANQGAFVVGWSGKEVEDIFALRAVLECFAVETAARKLSRAQLDELRRLQATMDEAAASAADGKLDRIAEANDRFHKLIISAADNARLAAMLSGLIDIAVAWGTFSRYDVDELRRSMNHHRELIAAFEARDGAWASAVMRAHIVSARAAFRRSESPGGWTSLGEPGEIVSRLRQG